MTISEQPSGIYMLMLQTETVRNTLQWLNNKSLKATLTAAQWAAVFLPRILLGITIDYI